MKTNSFGLEYLSKLCSGDHIPGDHVQTRELPEVRSSFTGGQEFCELAKLKQTHT